MNFFRNLSKKHKKKYTGALLVDLNIITFVSFHILSSFIKIYLLAVMIGQVSVSGGRHGLVIIVTTTSKHQPFLVNVNRIINEHTRHRQCA